MRTDFSEAKSVFGFRVRLQSPKSGFPNGKEPRTIIFQRHSFSVCMYLIKYVTLAHLIVFSIYTLSALGDSNNLIGSLSRTVTMHSPR